MHSSLHIKTDGSVTEVTPANGIKFTYDELRGFIGGAPKLVEIVPMPDGRVLVCDEEGKLVDEPGINETASQIWREQYPIDRYPISNDGIVVGDVLICDGTLLG